MLKPGGELPPEIVWLARKKPLQGKAVVAAFKRLGRGKRGELGVSASYFISLLELALKEESKKKRSKKRSKAARKAVKKTAKRK
jgi:hypothetical protein